MNICCGAHVLRTFIRCTPWKQTWLAVTKTKMIPAMVYDFLFRTIYFSRVDVESMQWHIYEEA